MHILVVEDNQAIANNIQKYLQLEDYTVDVAHDGDQGLKQALTHTYDCIVLDVMLPGKDGFTLCEEIRAKKKTPIIMATAKGELDDKETGFDGGADDYLVKPFELKELELRIRALLKRSQSSDLIRLHNLEIHVDENRVTKKGKEISLTLKERQILMTLIEYDGKTVTRTILIDEVRGDDDVWEHDGKLDVYISQLRRKLGKKLIETVKGVGYRLSE